MSSNTTELDGYSLIKDFKHDIHDELFCFCFWIYLVKSPFPATILLLVHPDLSDSVPFLVITQRKEIMFLPVLPLHEEAIHLYNSPSSAESSVTHAEIEFPRRKWVHVGCETAHDILRLYIDGEVVEEKRVTPSSYNSYSSWLRGCTLVGSENVDSIHGYVHNADIIFSAKSIQEHRIQNPPIQLSVDSSSVYEIEKDTDGVWNIVGGKCRRNFSLDVILSDAFGEVVNKEMEVVASLLYADNHTPVEKHDATTAPLLVNYEGMEIPSCDRPSMLLNGRASFKLKISQLSSKCDNRLFRIKFWSANGGNYSFLEVLSFPIRCISRSRTNRPSHLTWKKLSSSLPPNESQLSDLDDRSSGFGSNTEHALKAISPSKRAKLGEETGGTVKEDSAFEECGEEYNSLAWTEEKDETDPEGNSEGRLEIPNMVDNGSSDSENTEEGNSASKCMPSGQSVISDVTVFKYCLGSFRERSTILKEMASSASENDIFSFAQEVSLYSGCSHLASQIIFSKGLVDEGTKVWTSIAQNSYHVHWTKLAVEIEFVFMKISGCSTRSLTPQDFKVLRKIAGCGELVTREHFEMMWSWLYPVAFTISKEPVNSLWSCTSPRWIEGFITKEEAETSLCNLRNIQEPGTFVLRFPTSRSWPHPDAGSLVATYIGKDYTLHNKLLSLDLFYSLEHEMVSLQDMLLAEPQLSRLGRVIRSN